jgi:hypothetical protein
VAQEGMPNNYMSPSKFLVTRSDYKGNWIEEADG